MRSDPADYRLIAPGTVEEKIWELQQSKAQTIADVLGEEGFARSLTKTASGYAAVGALTLRGVTKDVPVEFQFTPGAGGATTGGA